MNYFIKILTYLCLFILVFIVIGLIILFTHKAIRKSSVRKLNDIECSNFINGISIDDYKVRKVLINELKIIKSNLKKVYLNTNWDTKRFLYEVIKDLENIINKLEINHLNEDELCQINAIINILKVDSNINTICEKVIFEWEKFID